MARLAESQIAAPGGAANTQSQKPGLGKTATVQSSQPNVIEP